MASKQQLTVACPAGGNGVYFDNSAYSLFQILSTNQGSTNLEYINQYGQLCNYIIDNTMSKSQKAGMSSMIGCNAYNNMLSAPANAAAPAYGGSAAAGMIYQTEGDRSGQSIATGTTVLGLNAAPIYNFCLPLMSGVIGANCSKMFPIGALSGSGIKLEFTTASIADAFYAGAGAVGLNYQIVNFELEICYVEVDTDQNIYDTTKPIYLSGSTYRQASSSIPTAFSGEYNTILGFRYVSLNALYARFRNQANAAQMVNASAAYRGSSSINPNFGQYYWKIGQNIYPAKPVQLINGNMTGSGNEAQAELAKSFHSLSTATGPAYTTREYNVSSSAFATGLWTVPFPAAAAGKATGLIDTFANAFSIGIELTSFANSSDTILCGVNTQNTQLNFVGIVYNGLTAGGGGADITCDFFASYDFLIVITNGQCSIFA